MDKKIWDKEVFLKNCKELCREHGINQKEFNARIGYRDALTKWQNRKRPVTPGIDVINRIVEEFNCDICWLMTGRDVDTNGGAENAQPVEVEETMNASLLKTIESLSRSVDRLTRKIEIYEQRNREPEDAEADRTGPRNRNTTG